jgi:sulfur relay (sulfurtransferase) DsrC/TusE family protein
MDTNIGENIVPNIRYITKYVKEHYVQKKIRRDLYERFIKWCGGDSINTCLEKALSVLESNIGTNIASNIVTNIGENIVPNIGTNTADSRDIRHNIQHNIRHNTEGNTPQHIAQSGAKSRKSAFEIFMERGYTFFSDLAKSRSVRFPERLFEAIKRSALGNKVKLVEVKTDEDRVLLKAEKWEEFKKKLAEVKSPDEREVFSVLKEDWERKLFTTLSKAGAIYFHAKSKNWELDRSFIEELEESPSSPTAVGDEEL